MNKECITTDPLHDANAKHRSEFFANASHELKTPLTAIKGFNELLSIHNKDENIRKYINSKNQ
jgi:two-component system phosphate regulon sensor histidine kinase PhoR